MQNTQLRLASNDDSSEMSRLLLSHGANAYSRVKKLRKCGNDMARGNASYVVHSQRPVITSHELTILADLVVRLLYRDNSTDAVRCIRDLTPAGGFFEYHASSLWAW